MSSAHTAPPAGFRLFLLSSLLLGVLAGAAAAQEGASTAAAARTRYLSEAGLVPASREVAVEEFVNYHRHQIGRPKVGEAVALDVRWGNDRVAPGGEAVLQVGFSTALANDREELRDANLAVVIDKSGSMAEADKLTRVKEALLTFVDQLRETDVLSLVVYDTEAYVLMPARRLGDREHVRQLIRGIEPEGATNLHGGLMLGYREVLKNLRRDATNRVILLTDGIANEGVTDPARIASDSLGYGERGIDLSTIGVGLDLNKDLLRQLAKSGRGLFHFVADAQDIDKVFLKEVQSLVSPVATAPNLEINFGPGLELVQLYGYEPRLRGGGLSLRLDNMNHGLTQVVLLRFRAPRQRPSDWRQTVSVRFNYYDVEQRRHVVKGDNSSIAVTDGRAGDMLSDPEVGKNYTIALLAQAIRDMAAASEARRYREAEKFLTTAIAQTYRRYPNLEDEDISRTLLIAQKYQDVLQKHHGHREERGRER
jgi:Ca-activated chloride channel homolog